MFFHSMDKTRFVLLLIILFSVFAVNLNCLHNESFFGDDYTYIVKNPSIRDTGNIPRFFTDPSTMSVVKENWVSYRPLTMLTYALNYRLSGLEPFGYHLFNVMLHLLNVLLVYLIMDRVSGDAFLSLTAAALFGLHPLNSEVVNYINTRSSVLGTSFYLLSFLLYVLRDGLSRSGATAFLFVASLLSFAVSFLAKELGITLPFILILYDQLLKGQGERKGYLLRAAHYAPYFLIVFAFVLLRKKLLLSAGVAGMDNELYDNVYAPAEAMLYQLRLLFLPFGLSLYYFDFAPATSLTPGSALSLAVLAAFLVLPLLLRRKEVAFFSYWIIITGIPTTVFDLKINYSRILDHRLYILSVGSCFLLAFLAEKSFTVLERLLKPTRPLAIKIAVALVPVLVFSALYLKRNGTWRDGVAIGVEMVNRYPETDLAHHFLAQGYQRAGLKDKAAEEYRKALEIAPANLHARINLASILTEKGMIEDAQMHYIEVLNHDPSAHNARFGLGLIYYKKGLYDQAIREVETGIGYFPYSTDAYLLLGDLYYARGSRETAAAQYNKALALSPDDPRPQERLERMR